jgi:hypothetical protein
MKTINFNQTKMEHADYELITSAKTQFTDNQNVSQRSGCSAYKNGTLWRACGHKLRLNRLIKA